MYNTLAFFPSYSQQKGCRGTFEINGFLIISHLIGVTVPHFDTLVLKTNCFKKYIHNSTLKHSTIVLHSDNLAEDQIINKKYQTIPNLMQLMRRLMIPFNT